MALLNGVSKCMLPRSDPVTHSTSTRLSAHVLLRTPCPFGARPFSNNNSNRSTGPSRTSKVTCRIGFLQSLFSPKGAGASGPDPRAKELVQQLIELTEGTDSGAKVSQEGREEVAELVGQLSRYSVRNPVRSPLLWGEYEVLYSSKPSAVGGPLRKGPGPLVFSGQNAKQILTAPDELLNFVEFKTLGLLPGYSKQFGTITPTSGDTFVLNITKGEIKTGFGGPIIKEFDIQRKIQILYLDETLRIVKFLPSEELQDDEEEASNEPSEEILFVFRRLGVEEEEEEEEEEAADDSDGEEQQKPRLGSQLLFGSKAAKQEGAATQAEKQARQIEPKRGGSRVVAKQAAPSQSAQADPAKREAEAARAEEAKKAAAIRELLAELGEEVKERQEAAREAQRELKEVERSNASSSLKAAAAARAQIERVEKEANQVAAAAAAAAEEKRAAEERLRAAAAKVKEAEAALRAVRK